MIPEKFIKFAALGALGVAGGAFAAYAALLVAFLPTPTSGMPGNGGGFDTIGWQTVAVALLVPIALLAAWHVDFAKQLKAGRNTCPGV
ncbi:MAG: hypothetical protein FJ202_05680 [Gemmatimonadetes bacterium]|nr:hypothetical protein [Gemmatimonadota bacterium]